MQCPVCESVLNNTVELDENLQAAACEKCGGYWISNRNYTVWLDKHGPTLPEKEFSEIVFDVEDVQEAKICPECSRILLKYKVGHGLDFFVDHCPGCGGIWLDKNEWDALRDKNLHDEINKMFSTTWQKEVRGEQMAAKLEQVYRSRFGAKTYQLINEIREWLKDHPQKRAIMAFLQDDDPYKI
jgi:Zn-finger nucleic acid-binding protein